MKIVAEIGASHAGSIARAVKIIHHAAMAGADAIKLQTWSPDTMDAGDRWLDAGPWKGTKLRDLYKAAHTPWDWHPILAKVAKEEGLEWWSTPFDAASVDFLESLGCPRYKIASFELVDLPLISYAAKTGKPLILSTGMATLEEIRAAVFAAGESRSLTLLRCISSYPANPSEFNLRTMRDLRHHFGCLYGVSDHTRDTTIPTLAVAMGASMIERHITRSHGDGLDDSFASSPEEFTSMVRAVRTAQEAMGEVKYGPTPSEGPSLALRRSLWTVKPIRRGERITTENVRSARPAEGMWPGYLPFVLDKTVIQDLRPGTPLQMHHIQGDAHDSPHHQEAQRPAERILRRPGP